MNRPDSSNQYLDTLATIAAATAESGGASSGEPLLFLRQHLRLCDAHVCRAGEGGGSRRVLDIGGGYGAECALPEPRWDQLGCTARTDEGWVAGFVVPRPPGHAVLHLLFDRLPGRDDLAAGVVAAALIARILPTRTTYRPEHPDPITGLPGRPALERHLLDHFAAQDPADSVSLILADVNGLKMVNDRFGHPAGDRLLGRVAAVVSDVAASLGGRALAARIGGDEFAIAAGDVSPQAVEKAIERVDVGARELGGGTGIARGAARLPGHAPGSRSPAAAMHGLIRLADAQLYAHKLSSTTSSHGRHTGRRQPTENAGTVPSARTVLDLPRYLAGQSVEERLGQAAQGIAESANAAAWWLSRQDGDTVLDIRCGPSRRKPLRWDEPERPVVLESKAYPLDDFPATRRALAGGHFHATLIEGDEAERAVLAYVGYRSVLGAGGTDDHGRGWLIEIYGDYLTEDLSGWGEHLQMATQAALTEFEVATR